MPSVREIYQFDELTWPEVNQAVDMGKIPIIPTGSVEQHGHHLPLKVDHLCATAIATEAARLRSNMSLVLPQLWVSTPRNGFPRILKHTLRTFHSICTGYL